MFYVFWDWRFQLTSQNVLRSSASPLCVKNQKPSNFRESDIFITVFAIYLRRASKVCNAVIYRIIFNFFPVILLIAVEVNIALYRQVCWLVPANFVSLWFSKSDFSRVSTLTVNRELEKFKKWLFSNNIFCTTNSTPIGFLFLKAQ